MNIITVWIIWLSQFYASLSIEKQQKTHTREGVVFSGFFDTFSEKWILQDIEGTLDETMMPLYRNVHELQVYAWPQGHGYIVSSGTRNWHKMEGILVFRRFDIWCI